MRSYLINANHVTVCEPPPEPDENEIVVASLDELSAAGLTGKQLLSLWNAWPAWRSAPGWATARPWSGNLWSVLEGLPDPEPVAQRHSKQADVVAMLRRPQGVTVVSAPLDVLSERQTATFIDEQLDSSY